MRKKILFALLSVFFSNLIITQNNNLPGDFNQPNKPKITNLLPESAYEYVYKAFQHELSCADTEFIMFLQNRYKKSKLIEKLEEEDKLITALSQDFTNNKNLSEKNRPSAAFAVAVQSLYFHQLIAETRSYPQDYILAPFEQKYNLKLYPVAFYNFVNIRDSIPAAQKALCRQTVIRNFAKFLLLKKI